MLQPELFAHSDDVELAIYTWGEKPTAEHPKEVLVFAHGYPDRAIFWEKIAQALKDDFYVVAFDMRGCGESTHIQGYKHYKFNELLKDLFAVIDAVSPNQKVHLIGHDWGGIYGWNAIRDAEGAKRIASFTTMAPSLEQVGVYLKSRLFKPTPTNLWQLFNQLARNSLMTFFSMPILPELMWRIGLGAWLMKTLVTKGERNVIYHKNEGLEGDAIRYLGIYRANLLQRVLTAKVVQTDVPVHTLIAVRDPFLPPRLFADTSKWATQHSESFVNASHWAPLSCPNQVAETIHRFTTSLQPNQ
ncbi:alpha/beta fold hydrolase [Acinetobacter shaoyimingii]|uniref:Alpha/beta fold hydrolase n=1 Tax=Acinetobacter shaoyimingii TaxID=2715164 RepID=A0A6G8RVQ1_9GAMM|nr:alpha/beta fold hydrolase [Acinetobacter shaoyimingii]QIO05910.1 alpha/beta fold hydrolase [Acinetobacter shaoyimingii]